MGRVGFVFGFGLRARLFVPFLVPSKKNVSISILMVFMVEMYY